MPSLPVDLFVDEAEAPRTDSCRPHGIPFDRALCPPDDVITDAFAALAASIDAGCIELDEAEADGSSTVLHTPGAAHPSAPRSGRHSPDRGAWWDGAPL